MQRDYNWQYIKASTHMNKFEQFTTNDRLCKLSEHLGSSEL